MPCTVTKQEIEYYEMRHNLELYGLEWTEARLTTAVACACAEKLKELGSLDTMPPWVQGWLVAHAKADEVRT